MSDETSTATPIKVIDVITGLLEKEQVEEAVDLQLDAIFLAVEWDKEVVDVLELPIDDFVKLYEIPKIPVLPVVRGKWDSVIYGEAAFR